MNLRRRENERRRREDERRRREYERRRREYERIEFRNKVIKYTTGAAIVVGCVALTILYRRNMMAYIQRAM